jgi:hypothetical protein
MARFNQEMKRNPARRMQSQRRASLEALGADIGHVMAEHGVGERKALAIAERDLGVLWHNGAFGRDAGHYPPPQRTP